MWLKIAVGILLIASTIFGAELRFDAQGSTIQVLRDGQESYAAPPSVVQTVVLDGATNSDLIQEAAREPKRFTFNGGVRKDGQLVAINGDGTLKISLGQAKQIWDAIKTQAAFDALTAAQKAEALRRANKMIILLLVKEGILSPQDFQ